MIRSAAILLAFAFATTAPATAQIVNPLESEALVKKAVNRPGTIYSFYGPGLTSKPMKQADLPGGQFVRVTVPQKGANPWEAGGSYPIEKPIKAGDVVFFAIFLRAPELKDGETTEVTGLGVSKNGEPYTSVAVTTARVDNKWAVYYAAGKATANYGRDQARIGMQLASNKQVLDLGPVFAIDLGPDYDMSTLPHN